MKRMLALVLAAFLALLPLAGCGAPAEEASAQDGSTELPGLTYTEAVLNSYATEFFIERYEGGYSLITISGGSRFLVIPPEGETPEGLDEDIVCLRQPLDNLYVAASAAMDLFSALDSLDAVRFCGLNAEDWYIDSAREAMEQGALLYAGKYSGPDYELLLSEGCSLSVQNMMIEHAPEVREKLEELGIPVLVDHSSYEEHPLGRCEWIKVYGALLGKDEEAAALFDEQEAYLTAATQEEATGKTVAFFYINASGEAVCRSGSDYVTKMISLAGGESAFESLADEESTRSTVTVEMETFYQEAKDADVIIYNTNMGGDVATLEELLAKVPLLADCKAVQTGDVWCTEHSFYQETMSLGEMIGELHEVLSGADGEALRFLHRLEGA